ncbi:uncharacterized protein LOC135209154 [Macrobrachium nipponense]|uniref:uncharacterized protein LOC135209154 n=1 Tax=Macrobrachium nipponense TaxID=159736 RepID=UPI0030C7AAD4
MELGHLWVVFVLFACQVSRTYGITTKTPVENNPSGDHTEGYDDLQLPETTLRSDTSENLLGCEHLSVKGISRQNTRIREIKGKDYTFFVHPREDFVRLTFRLRLQNVLDVTDVFDTQETVEIHRSDLEDVGGNWVKVDVQYYRYARTGPNYHALRVTVGANTQEVATKYWWLTHTFEGFLLSAEGSLDLIFNCSPDEYFPTSDSSPHAAAASSSSWVWLLAGCLVSLALMLVALGCIVSRFRNHRQGQQETSSAANSLVYEEFDEEMLAKIQQKVEALREGRASKNDGKSCGKNDYYVIEMAPMKRNAEFPGTHRDRYDHYDLPLCIKKQRHSKRLSLQWSCLRDESPSGENHYETLYPRDYSMPLGRDGGGGGGSDARDKSAAGDGQKNRVHSWHVVATGTDTDDDHVYENLRPSS